ncbi:ThuA domain-containing protein [Maribellus maritimus]|uniref:ThuA domain-containing protein n=1 Tax=Maribellus maritimus TaxID=2870838 RepID=UPI001EEBFD03|nr:ThuA domain-containing protein [Maribellus maritimus]MCG6187679.1 ThuA domain-containing protein [Maribellus maritimus]
MKKILFFPSVLLFVTLLSCAQENQQKFENAAHILVFSKTEGFRHESISSGLKMLVDQSKSQNWVITATENAGLLSDPVLKDFDVIVFLNPSGDALSEQAQDAFKKFMDKGKGFVGIHAAADCEHDWLYYGNLIGAYFKTHPPAQEATINFENNNHPAMLPFSGIKSYTTFDEWYSFKENPRENVHVLATLDESTIKKSNNNDWKMGDHPIIWWQENNGVRSFYTGFGHTHEAFQDKKIIEHITNAVNWAAKRID